jgi:hypothetical protein
MKYKFLRLKSKKIVSENHKSGESEFVWEIGKWYTELDKLSICSVGFHCSNTILDALSWVPGEILAIVETKGKSIKQKNKECWEQMKVIKAYHWTKKDSLQFAIYSAELVINIYEKKYPNDDRPRKAIEAAKKVLQKDTKANRAAAGAAEAAAWAAARAAAGAEARAAETAARAAEAAAWAAARTAEAAAEAAAWAAAWAAEAVALDKIEKWLVNYIKELKEVKND